MTRAEYTRYKTSVIAYICMFIQTEYGRYEVAFDEAYDIAVKLARKFINSEWDSPEETFYTCIEQFLEESKLFAEFLEWVNATEFKKDQELKKKYE